VNAVGDDVEVVPFRIVDDESFAVPADALVDPIEGPVYPTPAGSKIPVPRLARHEITLDDGHVVGVAVSGRGVPLVVVHGFTAEGFLYAQSLSRLVSMGFKVIAIDTAGHGGTQGLPAGGGSFEAYTKVLSRAVDELGIKRAMFAGHSMGGRLITQLAASEPERAIAVLCIDAIVGETWDRRVNAMRLFPPAAGLVGIAMAVDGLLTVPVFGDRTQAAKLLRLVTPTLLGHARRPWRLMGPGVSIIRSRGSRWMLQRIAQENVPFFALHGDRDVTVPLKTAIDAARRARGTLVTVHGGSHSWVLRDPETLPGIIGELLTGPLGEAYRAAVRDAGLDPDAASVDDLEAAFYDEEALVLELTPAVEFSDTATRRRAPRYVWTVADHRSHLDADRPSSS